MPILYAELQLPNLRVGCDTASFSFRQYTDWWGRPNSTVCVGLLRVTLTGAAAARPEWARMKLDSFGRHSGHLLFFDGEGQTAQRYSFYDAALVHYASRLTARGPGPAAALQTELHFAAATVELNGQRVHAYSRLPWATDEDTSFRALTPPPAPLPWLGLTQVPFRLAPPPVAAPAAEAVGGGLLGAVAARALGTVGLLLAPANDPNAPGYAAEKHFSRDHPLPPDRDAVRLAELERLRQQRALTAEEEAEYVALLARVKGIHGADAEKPGRFDIDVAPEDKIDRTLLNPPTRPGNAPTFKRDNTSVEIHHMGQAREGPFKEMHWQDHRGQGNDKINHPDKAKPSRVDRDEFEKAKRRYWKKEFPKK